MYVPLLACLVVLLLASPMLTVRDSIDLAIERERERVSE